MFTLFSQLKQNKMLQVALTAGGGLILLILSYFFIRGPILKYKQRLKEDFTLSQEKLKETEELVRRFPNPQKATEELEKKSQELKEMGVSSRQIPRLIQLLALPAGKLGINVSSIRPRDDLQPASENLPPGVNKVYLEITMISSYQLLADYAKALGELPTAFILERLSAEKKEEEEKQADTSHRSAEKSADKQDELLVTLLVSTYTVLEI